MSDLSDELRDAIDGAAAPVTFEEITARAPDARRRRPAWRTALVTSAVVAALLIGGVVVASVDDGDGSSTLHVAAPTVAVGDIDLAVLATSFDEDGARGPVPPALLDAVRGVTGVAAAQGAMQRFVEVLPTGDLAPADLPPASARSAIAISWEDGAPLDFVSGRAPKQSGEIAINQSLADQYRLGVGADVAVNAGPSTQYGGPTATVMHVVGVFNPAGGDVEDINLVVLGADDLAALSGRATFDRVDIVASAGVAVDDLIDRVAAALPAGYMVVPPSVVGFDTQLRAELEIQRAYHWLIDPDLAKRQQATDAPADPATAAQNEQTYDQHLSETVNTELRVSRVAFVDSATALVTYRVFYGGQHSPVARNVMTGVAMNVDGSWRISKRGICELAKLENIDCDPGTGPDPASLTPPPDGWNRPDAAVGAADAFRVLADPASNVDQRVAVVENGGALRSVITAGAAADAGASRSRRIPRRRDPSRGCRARPGALLGDRRGRAAARDSVPARRERGAGGRHLEGRAPLRVRPVGPRRGAMPDHDRAAGHDGSGCGGLEPVTAPEEK